MLLSVTVIALFCYLAGNNEIFLVVAAIAGSLLGFLRFNTYPAPIFVGDAGSQLLGFSIGVLSVLLVE